MYQLLLAAAVVVVAVGVGLVLRRRQRVDAPTQPVFEAPVQLDRADFGGAGMSPAGMSPAGISPAGTAATSAPWLLAVFTSATCSSCADIARKAEVMRCAEVAVVIVEHPTHRDLHAKYAIEAVPIVVLADSAGVVHKSFVGPVTATDLWAGVAEAREGPVLGG